MTRGEPRRMAETAVVIGASMAGLCAARVLSERFDRAVDRGFGRRYFRAAAHTVAAPWSIAVGGDFAYAGTTGPKPPGTDLLNRYMERVIRAARHDGTVNIRFSEVVGLVRRPESLLTPAFLLRVLRSAR
ncbi:hypothetical protein [Streptomyces sp. NPDC091371]|uniref:hypothetical protein n=1 Tax=Streptomyces sp. NPDC091371 TaxID=3155303 RepID=UPI0034199B65